ncbi:MAG: Hpt domain-containing protein [Nitrospirae bacterium]|nr:Hpt domain-containing protein [Nitrospirota bacterium]
MTRNSSKKIIVHIDADLEALIPGFLQNRREDIKSILTALEVGDYQTIRILGHSMKGTGGGYGFDAISQIGYSIEKAATDRNAGEIKKLISTLSSYIESVEVIYV